MANLSNDSKIITWVGGIMSSLIVVGIIALFSMARDVGRLQADMANVLRVLADNQSSILKRIERLEDWQRAVNARPET